MRCFLKKPAGMCIKEYVSRVVNINNNLSQIPLSVLLGNSKKLPNNELLELLEFGILLKWRNQIYLQNFKVQEHKIKEFTKMCERLESALSDLPSSKQTNKGSPRKEKSCGNKKKRRNNSNENKGENNYSVLHFESGKKLNNFPVGASSQHQQSSRREIHYFSFRATFGHYFFYGERRIYRLY